MNCCDVSDAHGMTPSEPLTRRLDITRLETNVMQKTQQMVCDSGAHSDSNTAHAHVGPCARHHKRRLTPPTTTLRLIQCLTLNKWDRFLRRLQSSTTSFIKVELRARSRTGNGAIHELVNKNRDSIGSGERWWLAAAEQPLAGAVAAERRWGDEMSWEAPRRARWRRARRPGGRPGLGGDVEGGEGRYGYAYAVFASTGF